MACSASGGDRSANPCNLRIRQPALRAIRALLSRVLRVALRFEPRALWVTPKRGDITFQPERVRTAPELVTVVEFPSKLLVHMGIYDVTARKAHQWTMVALVALGFALGEPRGAWPLLLAGAIMLVGRFWWPADLIRQFVWRVAEPVGWLRRLDREEDHATRRVARVLGGAIWLAAAVLVANGLAVAGWVLAGAIAIMVGLDA